MNPFLKNIFSSALALSLIFASSTAHSSASKDELDSICGKALEDVKKKKSTQGDQLMAYCVQADLARKAKNVETAKSVIYLTGAAVCTTMAVVAATGYGAAVAKPVCMATSIAGAAAGLAADIGGKVSLNKLKDQYGEARDQVCSIATFTPLVMQAGAMFVATAGKTASGKDKNGCIACAITLGLTGGVSVAQSTAAKKTQKAMTEDAKTLKGNSANSVTALTPATMSLTQTTADAVDVTTVSNGGAATTDTCASLGGTAYLTCMGQFSPELAALSTSSEFLDQMQKSLHGQNLGDFVKNYDGESDLAAYVASGLGLSTDGVAAVMKNNAKMAKDTGMEKYSPMAYAKSTGSSKDAGSDLDFSKLMSGMLGKIDPQAAHSGSSDPSESVFRKLDLLPAHQIEANKDISLFARIAFRYRKNNANVEQLNWSLPENQGRTPASK